ncbi:substrate-binding domain-containing protein, partial [Clavibacter michiganensis]|uniref:substrate-binding domain-containing protein n=1 Tax=Clavibacter michiganensis TaxID=28447 RepID=UPI00292F86D1
VIIVLVLLRSFSRLGAEHSVQTTTDPISVAMEDGAKEDQAKDGIDLTLAAGKADGDEDTQIQSIENAISKGDKGILITINAPSVLDAIQKARDARLFVIALYTSLYPVDSVDITSATDTFSADAHCILWAAD